VRILQEDYDRFKSDIVKEFEIKETIIERKD
jgi:hypothetical protein